MNIKKWSYSLICVMIFASAGIQKTHAQKIALPFDRVTSADAMRQLYESDSIIHFSYKPLLLEKSEYDTLISRTYNRYKGKTYNRWLGRKLFRENLAIIQAEDLYFTIDLVTNLEMGADLEDDQNEQITTNTRGILIQGNITDKVFFRTDFYETQSYFPSYMDSAIGAMRSVPGQGKAKGFKTGGVDYPVVTGIVNFQATKNVNVQFGQDKLFIGNGYRSLLLSDNSAPFLYLQLGLSLFENKLNYHSNWAALQNLSSMVGLAGSSTKGDELFVRKQANFNYLSFKPNPKIEIGAFEGVMWERWNEHSLEQPFDAMFLNPVPFLTTAVKSSDTLVSSILGVNAFVKPLTHAAFYGQLSYGVENGGVGYQLGAKMFDVFKVKGLNFQVEYNQVGKGVYGTENAYTDYYHFNQPLAVQQLEDFSEMVVIANYRVKMFLLNLKYTSAQIKNNTTGPGNISNYDANLAYIINPMTNLMINGGVRYRTQENNNTTNWVYFGVKTNLRNLYYDF